jgi:NitT/TauT family transport system substrate-binding protein
MPGNMIRRIPTTSAALVVAVLALHCKSSDPPTRASGAAEAVAAAPAAVEQPAAPAKTKLTVATIPIVDVAPIYLGKEKGFFAEQGLELTLVPAQGGAVIVPGVVSGQYEIGFGNVVSLMLARSKGLPLKVIAAGNFSTGDPAAGDFGAIVVPPGSKAKTAKDLESKTVATNNLHNIGDLTVRASVRKAGGDPNKVKFIEISFPDVPAALAKNRIDAAFVVEPFLTVAKAGGSKVLAWNLIDSAPNLMISGYFTTSEYAEKNPEVVKHFTAAINQSLTYTAEHPDEARAILTTYTKINQETAGKITLPKWTAEINRDSCSALADLMVLDKLVTEKPDVAALLP